LARKETCERTVGDDPEPEELSRGVLLGVAVSMWLKRNVSAEEEGERREERDATHEQ